MKGGFMAVDRITLTANLPVAIAGLDEMQLAQEGAVYTWDEAAAQYGPRRPLERLVTFDTTGTGDFELLFHSDGSPIWY
jgi:hypothetical protein